MKAMKATKKKSEVEATAKPKKKPKKYSSPAGITYAAGGIVWRKTRKGRQVLLIVRPDYQDWSLPKGHIDEDDLGWDTAAQREVKEETGYDTVITGFAGFTSYKVKGKPKVVFFWHMKPVGKSDFAPSSEVAAYEWVAVEAAVERLSYEKDKELLRQFLT